MEEASAVDIVEGRTSRHAEEIAVETATGHEGALLQRLQIQVLVEMQVHVFDDIGQSHVDVGLTANVLWCLSRKQDDEFHEFRQSVNEASWIAVEQLFLEREDKFQKRVHHVGIQMKERRGGACGSFVIARKELME